jgi:hypothetical protein
MLQYILQILHVKSYFNKNIAREQEIKNVVHCKPVSLNNFYLMIVHDGLSFIHVNYKNNIYGYMCIVKTTLVVEVVLVSFILLSDPPLLLSSSPESHVTAGTCLSSNADVVFIDDFVAIILFIYFSKVPKQSYRLEQTTVYVYIQKSSHKI